MSSQSSLRNEFIIQPMELKEITSVGGTGKVFGEKLKMQGFHYAYQSYGQFLLLKKDGDAFVAWFKSTCGANTDQAHNCCCCLREWGIRNFH